MSQGWIYPGVVENREFSPTIGLSLTLIFLSLQV